MYVERLDFLAKNPRFTQRYAMHVGALCREMTNKAVAELERLHDSTVKLKLEIDPSKICLSLLKGSVEEGEALLSTRR